MSQRHPSFEPTLLPPDEGELELPALPENFGFTEEHQLLRDNARRWLSERCPISEVRALAEGRSELQRALHRELGQLGWLDLAGPGDEGLSPLHIALLSEEMGRSLLPAAYLPSLLALTLLDVAGSPEQRAELRPSLVSGNQIATVAASEADDCWDPAQFRSRARPAVEGFVLQGEKTHVPFAAQADVVMVPCREPTGTIGVFAVELDAPGVSIEPEVGVDATRPAARILLDDVRVARAARMVGDGLDAWRALESTACTWLAAEMVGAADAVLELTRKYATERFQFGRAIGSFQAVKHPLVDTLIAVEQARSLALGAAALLCSGARPASVAARMAKAAASEALALAVKKGVQLHGGFGFTWDCDVQLYFKRMLQSRGLYGDAVHHRRQLAARLLGAQS